MYSSYTLDCGAREEGARTNVISQRDHRGLLIEMDIGAGSIRSMWLMAVVSVGDLKHELLYLLCILVYQCHN